MYFCFLNQDDNRYNAGRGAHLNLKRAEKARILVNKIPGMAESDSTFITTWCLVHLYIVMEDDMHQRSDMYGLFASI